MPRRFHLLPLALLLLVGCDTTDPAARGMVQGIVLIEGTALQGITVELTGPANRSTTTDGSGRYRFDEVPAGAYVVSIRGLPQDAAFPALSRSAVVGDAATVTVDFQGSFIRTSSISGTVASGDRGVGGITVVLRGADSGSTTSDGSGRFSFPGLRSGSYEVEITDIPPFLTFPNTRRTVQVGIGEDVGVAFNGQAEVTASLAIRSLERVGPAGEFVPIPPDEVRGEIRVTVELDRGQDVPDSILVLLAGEVVGKQVFDQGLVEVGTETEADGAGEEVMTNELPLLSFVVNTAAFDQDTGEPRFLNGETLLSVRLATREAGPEAWTVTLPVVLTNPDTFVGRFEGSRGPERDAEDREWWGGDLTVELTPVVYSPERRITSATLEIRGAGGSVVARQSVLGEAPFTAVFPEAPGEPGSIAGYQTLPDAGDDLRVVTARYADGSLIPGLPIFLASELRLDLVPPEPVPFALPRQSGTRDCCLENWVGRAFPFAEALDGGADTALVDTGVGGAGVVFHVAGSGSTNQELLDSPAVVRGEQLLPTEGNSAYRALAVLTDALGNQRFVSLEPSPGNPLSNALGGVFGVDASAPGARLDPDGAGLGPREANPAPGALWVLDVDAGASGVGSLPARTTVKLLAPEVAGEESCIRPDTGPCEPVPTPLILEVPSSPSGYLLFRSRVLDRGGNRSLPVEARVLRDTLEPEVGSISLPSSLSGGALRSFAATASDDVDLHLGQMRLRFGGGEVPSLPFAPPDTMGIPFTDDLVAEAGFVVRFPFVTGLERVLPPQDDPAPDGDPLRAMVVEAEARDAAGNLGFREEGLPGSSGFTLRSFGVETRGEAGVARWTAGTDTDQVCRPGLAGAEGCGDASLSLTLTAEARGAAGSFPEPFARVHLLLLQGEGQGVRWLAMAEGAGMTEEGEGPTARSWRWALKWTPDPKLPPGPLRFLVVGVDGEGMALLTREVTGTELVEGS